MRGPAGRCPSRKQVAALVNRTGADTDADAVKAKVNRPKAGVSFYKRPLPETCTAFTSPAGRSIFASALQTNGLKSYFPLMEQFTTQSEPAFCGISTLVVVLNALAVDPRQTWKGPWRWYHEGMLNCCLDLEDVAKTGITLKDFVCLAQCQGLSVDATHCNSDDQLDDFRQAVRIACTESSDDLADREQSAEQTGPTQLLVASYSRKVLGQTGSGHFSPIAAYDEVSDKVLILDTARFKYGVHWVDLPTVFEAMRPKDPTTKMSRGFALLSFKPIATAECGPSLRQEDETQDDTKVRSSGLICKSVNTARGCACPQPVSLLFRSKMAAGPLRRKYKEFVNSIGADALTWEDVYGYWTKDGEMDVWRVLEPLSLANDCEEDARRSAAMREALLEVAKAKMKTTTEAKATVKEAPAVEAAGATDAAGEDEMEKPAAHACSKLGGDSIFFDPVNAICLLYLASVPECRRKAELDSSSGASKNTKEWLLNEANLVAIAVDISDKTTLG